MKPPKQWIGLDIGGANLKAAHSQGMSKSVPFELWKRFRELPKAINQLIAGLPSADAFAVTMTAELCDCYETKTEGVNHILDALASRKVSVWGCDGRFHSLAGARSSPILVAASNWLALATWVTQLENMEFPALLIDIGSTTSDLIPLSRGHVASRSRTDTERLQTGELVYAGARRTPLCALATELPLRGMTTGLAAELFATTLDVYLMLGDIVESSQDMATADGRAATRDRARDRLARMVGADRDAFSSADAAQLSASFNQLLVARLETAAGRLCSATIGTPRTVVISGSGEFLARRVAIRLVPEQNVVSLADLWGPAASDAACAHAIVRLAEELQE